MAKIELIKKSKWRIHKIHSHNTWEKKESEKKV